MHNSEHRPLPRHPRHGKIEEMQNIITSASKIVFILMAVGATVGFFTGHLSENNFMILAGAAFTFYFSNKGDTSGTTPFAGK